MGCIQGATEEFSCVAAKIKKKFIHWLNRKEGSFSLLNENTTNNNKVSYV